MTTVVLKLFNIVQPHMAYFGQKDAQQTAIIKRMVRDLNLSVAIKILPIVREPDGLAMSSRNEYLNRQQRKDALVLYQSLLTAKNMIDTGAMSCDKIIRNMYKMIKGRPTAVIDYISIVDAETLEDVKVAEGKLLIALAVFFGKARLIDNILVKAGKR